MIRRLRSSKVEDTDSRRLSVIVYNTLIGHVEAVRILRASTWHRNTLDWQRYILAMAFRLAMAGSRWDLKRDTHRRMTGIERIDIKNRPKHPAAHGYKVVAEWNERTGDRKSVV